MLQNMCSIATGRNIRTVHGHPHSSRARLHVIVHGVVQGVNFRYHTRRQARALLLDGWVRNLPDGAVEVLAEGPRDQLDALLCYLHHGPPAAQVTHVDPDWQAYRGDLAGFDIAFT